MKKRVIDLSAVFLFLISMSVMFFFEYNGRSGLLVSHFDRRTTVVIDAGHGGEDGGAVGSENILEKDINLSVSHKLELLLNFLGVNTDMTRADDSSLGSEDAGSTRQRKVSDIKRRVEKINNTPSAVLISVHQNSFPQDKRCSGAQVFYSENNIGSEALAENLQDELKNNLNPDNNRKQKPGGKNIYLLNHVNCPAVLVECGFMSNKNEMELLMSDMYRTKLAICIASGFLNYESEVK
ncbi:MAG: N-acetylmuramoyl-L-alanine amidase [Oscillospiraceae bacterium]|nr:N-acetylmuramoyl-L-alanine amidase [Oscillospiraceae bacterium]